MVGCRASLRVVVVVVRGGGEEPLFLDPRRLLGLLGLPLASALVQLLLGFGGRRGGGVVVVVGVLGACERRAEQEVTYPGFHQGEGRAVGVTGRHGHLGDGRTVLAGEGSGPEKECSGVTYFQRYVLDRRESGLRRNDEHSASANLVRMRLSLLLVQRHRLSGTTTQFISEIPPLPCVRAYLRRGHEQSKEADEDTLGDGQPVCLLEGEQNGSIQTCFSRAVGRK